MSAFSLDPSVLALLGGGSALSSIGQLIGGGSNARAVRRADDDQVGRFRGQQGQFGTGVFGEAYGRQPYYQTIYQQGLERNDPNLTRQGLEGMQAFTNATGGPILDQQRQLANSVSQRQTGNLGYFDQDTNRLSALANQMGGQNSQASMLAAGTERMAGSTGIGRDRIIRQDATRDQRNMDATARAQLAASGFGNSTAVGNATRANAQSVGENRDRALQASTDARLGAQMNARNTRVNLANQQGQQQIGREYQRSGDRMTLENQNLTREIGLRQDPISTSLQTQSGAIFNPFLGYNAPVAANTGSANALGSIGGSLTAGGNYINNANLLQSLFGGQLNPNDMRPGGTGGVYGPPNR